MRKQFFSVTILIAIGVMQSCFFKASDNTLKIPETDHIPVTLRGKFQDDYGIRYSISDTLWLQHPDTRYHIIFSDTTGRYLIVQNDVKNKSDAGLFTRIDYMRFSGMEPFTWGFCLTMYNADSVEKARMAISADRENPKKGCGGFPFSRMKRLDE